MPLAMSHFALAELQCQCLCIALLVLDFSVRLCTYRAGIDVRSTLDNLANAALLAAEVEQEELEAAAAAPPPARAGKTSVRTVARRPNKKPRSSSATSSPGDSSGGPASAEGQGHAGERPLAATASQTKLTEMEVSQGQGNTAAAAALPQSDDPLVISQPDATDAGMHASASQQNLHDQVGLQGNPAEAVTASDVFDPVAAAIRNATEAITTDGAMQASLPDIDMGLEDISMPEQAVSDSILPASSQAISEGVAAYLDPVPPQQLPDQLPLQVEQPPSEAPAEHVTVQDQCGTVTYPIASDGTVTITTSHPAASAPGATMMVQQPEGLLFVRDPSTGKERCLGKLLTNSRQTSLILQAANFLEPMST